MLALAFAPPVLAATSLTRHGVTWTFDRDYRSGTFVNGDPWVVGPVTIRTISPRDPDLTDDIDLHGTVINPLPVRRSPYRQSWDSRINGGTTYDRAANVARALPLRVEVDSSVVSVVSRDAVGEDRLVLSDAAVLTVLEEEPPPGSFRPPYAGTDKRILGRVSDLDFSRFHSLPRVSGAPSLNSLNGKFEQVLLDVIGQWPNTTLKTANAGPAYGRDIAQEVNDAVLSLNLNYSVAQKEPLLIKLVQRGLDTYGLARNGMVWWPNGGHNCGRKLPLLIAGLALNRPEILEYGDAQRHFIFQEDMQHWYLGESDLTTPRADATLLAYTADLLGVAEWASNPVTERDQT
ncbi:MAG TPA: hypothetical protein VHF69_12860, partial [Candidatus Synoicihabitans sp.]|nr:hypothetical protein [Candidatus Synoicihabitans sp.]